jgi:hypothetical protein
MRSITKTDIACGLLAIAAWGVWLGANNPRLAVWSLMFASVLAFTPTIRKSWHGPWDEPTSKYVLSTLRYVLSAIAVQKYSFVTGAYVTLWIGVNGAFVIYLEFRRRCVPKPAVDSRNLPPNPAVALT